MWNGRPDEKRSGPSLNLPRAAPQARGLKHIISSIFRVKKKALSQHKKIGFGVGFLVCFLASLLWGEGVTAPPSSPRPQTPSENHSGGSTPKAPESRRPADFIEESQHQLRFQVPSPQGYTIVGGDSGAPIFNQKGQLICPISGSSYEGLKRQGLLTRKPDGNINTLLDPFTVVCDKYALARLRKTLEKLELV